MSRNSAQGNFVQNLVHMSEKVDQQNRPAFFFDSKVVDAINEFGNDPNKKYNLNPTDEDEGNCNSSSSTILKKAGVSNEVIEDIKDNMKGIHWGFSSTPKPWTKTEQKNAVEEESQRRIEENKRLDAMLKCKPSANPVLQGFS